MTLTWQSPTNTQGYPILKYELERTGPRPFTGFLKTQIDYTNSLQYIHKISIDPSTTQVYLPTSDNVDNNNKNKESVNSFTKGTRLHSVTHQYVFEKLDSGCTYHFRLRAVTDAPIGRSPSSLGNTTLYMCTTIY